MKKSILSLAAIIMVSTFMACKKSDSTPTDPAHVGLWKGKYGGTSNYPSNGYAMLLRNNGTVRVFDGSDTTTAGKAEGTYTISGTSINATYTYVAAGGSTFSTAATINSKSTFIEGTWGSGTNTTNGGKYFLVKE